MIDNIFNNKSILKNLERNHLIYHICYMNHIINIVIQKFLKICKILNIMKSIIDKDLYNIDDEDDFIKEELEKRATTAIILNNLKY